MYCAWSIKDSSNHDSIYCTPNTSVSCTVVLYIGIMKFGDFGQKLSPQNQLDIYFLTHWEYWLGLAKPKNVFRSILNPSIKWLWNFKNFEFNAFFYWLIYLLMPSDKHNLRTAGARDLISSLINVTSSGDVPFHQPQLLQCLHQGATFVPLWCPILFFRTA